MSETINIQELIDLFPNQEDDCGNYYDRSSGNYIFLTEEDFYDAENDTPKDEIPPNRQEKVHIARRILEKSQRYIGLPAKSELDEYSIMDDYAHRLQDRDARKELQIALKGRAVFEDFDEVIGRYSLDEDWFNFRKEVFVQIATKWCKENGLDFE